MARYDPWVDMPAGTTTTVEGPPQTWLQRFQDGSFVRNPEALLLTGFDDLYAGNAMMPNSTRQDATYDPLVLAQVTWSRYPVLPVVEPPPGATVQYERTGYDLHTGVTWLYSQDITGWEVTPPFVDVRLAPWTSNPTSPAAPTHQAMLGWPRLDAPVQAISDELWNGLQDTPAGGAARFYSGTVPLVVPSERLGPFGPAMTYAMTTTPQSQAGGFAREPGTSRAVRPAGYLMPAVAVWRPWRYRFVWPSGMWTTRQKQTLTGTTGGWPLRQRQNGGATGSWPLRQRQSGM